MRKFIYLLFIGIVISLSSCRKDFDTVASSGNLEFSKTEVYLDTVFTDIGSSTYSLKVYNRSNKDISIPIVQLGKGLVSKYRIMVDGRSGNGKIFNNVELLAKDSMYIFIETTANIADTEPDFTYNDKILFDLGANQQSVDLITLIQDAKFYFPNRTLNPTIYETINVNGFEAGTQGHTLVTTDFVASNPWHWTKDRPYVVYGNLVVPIGETLTIEAGTSVHFHKDATLIIDKGAKIDIQGTLNILDSDGLIVTKNEVTFEGDRLEPIYEDVPGQWGALIILSELSNNIKHLTLKNAAVGIYTVSNLITPKLNIENSQIYDCSNYGILGISSFITGRNLVINYAGQASLVCSQGNYNFEHCTFNNNWPSSKQVSVLVNDYSIDQNNVATITNVNANFKNCIIYGSNNVELFLDHKGSLFTATFVNCLAKFNDTNTLIASDPFYNDIRNQTNGNIKNKDPKFKNLNKNKLNIILNSGAYQKGNTTPLFNDIINSSRTNPSDIGAYNFVP